MRKVCLINNFNYGKYLDSCLRSVLNQTVKFDTVYVVDDGSTDNSRTIIDRYKNNYGEIKPVYKENAGQLSCFNAAVDHVKDDDLVFLLDSDDIYPTDYVENICEVSRSHKYDMYFCDRQNFRGNETPPKTSVRKERRIISISNSSHLTRFTKVWVGKPTSTMVVTGELFRQIFPYPPEEDWVTRADDVLVFASSIAGFAKVFIPSLCIGYRVHGENSHFGKTFSRSYNKKRKRNIRRLFLWCNDKYSLKRIPSLVSALHEFETSKDFYQMVGQLKVWKIYVKYMIFIFLELFYFRKNLGN